MKNYRLVIFLLICTIPMLVVQSNDQPSYNDILNQFEKLRSIQVLDMSRKLKWTFTISINMQNDIIGMNQAKAIGVALKKSGYHYDGVNDADKSRVAFRFSIITIHTPDSLHKETLKIYPILNLEKAQFVEWSANALKGIESLLADLYSRRMDIRWSAAVELGIIKDPKSFEPLIAMMVGENNNLSWYATLTLVTVGAPAVESLIAALRKKSYRRKAVITMLATIKDERAVGPLINALQDSEIREYAIGALEHITGKKFTDRSQWEKWYQEQASK